VLKLNSPQVMISHHLQSIYSKKEKKEKYRILKKKEKKRWQ